MGAGAVEWRDFVNHHTTVADDLPSDKVGEFDEGFVDRHLLLCPAIVALDHFIGDINALVTI